jgi:hypothetical protein
MKRESSDLIDAIRAGTQPGGDLVRELCSLSDDTVKTAAEATVICQTLDDLLGRAFHHHDERACAALPALIGLFESVTRREAMLVLQEYGLPPLYAAFDHALSCSRLDADDLLLLLKVFANYATREGAERIIRAGRLGIAANRMMWSVIFDKFDEQHPQATYVIDRLRTPLPTSSLGVAYLECANRLSAAKHIVQHPFDTDDGRQQLIQWLRAADGGDTLQAGQVVASSLKFLTRQSCSELLALALDHHCPNVQIEAAAAAVYLGKTSAKKMLIRWCEDPRFSRQARLKLRELGLDEQKPAICEQPDFMAMSELCQWLSDPHEYSRAPDRIEMLDSRVLFWPPTDDLRQVWLFSYSYESGTGLTEDSGVGMVGSTTASLVGETTTDLPAFDIYALHCCWELQNNSDPRAPRCRSVKAGKSLVGKYNRTM